MSRMPVLLCLLIVSAASATTISVSGTIADETNWAADTVKVTGDIIIADGAVLTISAGVRVEFQGGYSITVNGRLLAEGVPTDSIVFTMGDTTGFGDTSTTTGGWAGIRFKSTPSTNDSSVLSYCILTFAKAEDLAGGALGIGSFNKVRVDHCLFAWNMTRTGNGGAIRVSQCSPTITHTTIRNNIAASEGGGIYLTHSSAVLTNLCIVNNSARFGGGLFLSYVNSQIRNVTIANNHATSQGGGLFCRSFSMPVLVNTILWGDSAQHHNEIGIHSYAVLTLHNCVVEGGAGSIPGSSKPHVHSECIADDPLFAAPSAGAGAAIDAGGADWRLDNSSPGTDAGAVWSRRDEDGTTADIGSFTSAPAAGNSFAGTGSLPSGSFGGAISGSLSGAAVIAEPVRVLSSKTLEIAAGTTVECAAGIEAAGTLTAVGTATDSITFTGIAGGWWKGVKIVRDTLGVSRLAYCRISGGSSSGCCLLASNSVIEHCRLSGNFCAYDETGELNGGAIACVESSSPVIANNVITGNESYQAGGAIACQSSNAIIVNNLISNNDVWYNGGAIAAMSSAPRIIGNVMCNNGGQRTTYGGCLYLANADAYVTNCTIANNRAKSRGGAIYCAMSSPIVTNTIVWANSYEDTGSQLFLADEPSAPSFSFCDIQGGSASFGGAAFTGTYEHCIDTDPLFVSPSSVLGMETDALSADWRLRSGSPCVNAGTPDTTGLSLVEVDRDGTVRLCGDTVDIGAYEYDATTPVGFVARASVGSSLLAWSVGSLKYVLPGPCRVTFRLFDSRGRQVFVGVDKVQNAGAYRIVLPPKLSQGHYVMHFRAGDRLLRRSITVL